MAAKTEKIRVQVELSGNEITRLNKVMEVCDLTSRKDLFSHALTLLEWAAHEKMAGRIVAGIDVETNDRHILSMPCLNAIEQPSA